MIIVEVKGRSWSLCTFALQMPIQYSLITPCIESLCYSNILVLLTTKGMSRQPTPFPPPPPHGFRDSRLPYAKNPNHQRIWCPRMEWDTKRKTCITNEDKSFYLWALWDDDANTHIKECLVLVVDMNFTFKGLRGTMYDLYCKRVSTSKGQRRMFCSGSHLYPFIPMYMFVL